MSCRPSSGRPQSSHPESWRSRGSSNSKLLCGSLIFGGFRAQGMIAFKASVGHRVRDMRHTRIVVSQYGGPEVLSVIEEDTTTPNAGEVRVKVLAAGVSLPDVLAREGVHPETPRVPYTPGWDLIGSVDQLGEGAGAFELGQPFPSTDAMRSTYACPNASLFQCPRVWIQRKQSRGTELHHRISDAASDRRRPSPGSVC
jgi:hypothetical protein